MNKVKVGFFSFTEITDPAAHREYNEWHQLDHMPEQFPMRGARVRAALGVDAGVPGGARCRWRAARRPSHYMTLYLFTDPVDETLQEFMDLGQQLRALGRFYREAPRGACRGRCSGSMATRRPGC